MLSSLTIKNILLIDLVELEFKNGLNTLTGETVEIRHSKNSCSLVKIQKASEDRIKPICQYFTTCGGCKTQHITLSTYQSWKRGIVKKALINQGLNINVDPLIDAHGQGRRRVSFHAKRDKNGIFAGLMKYRSHEILNIDHNVVRTLKIYYYEVIK